MSGTRDAQGEEASTLLKERKRRNKRYDRALTEDIRLVVHGNPELDPAEDLLCPLIQESEAVISMMERYDPAVGDVFTFGTAVASHGQSRHNKTRLMAIPGGECGEALRLIRLDTETYGWPEHDSRLLVPSPTDEVGWWVGKGAPIQHICSPEMLLQADKGSFLAVRLPGTLLIFRPHYRATPVPPAGMHPGCTIPPSRVDANLVLEISPRDWQAKQHADVAFNPWNQYGLAIVDQAGDWAIFELPKEHRGSQMYKPKLLHRGSLEGFPEISKVTGQTTALQPDGWARILWLGDKNTLLLCTRRTLQLLSISQKTNLAVPTFFPKNQWILDVRRCPTTPTWVFVLTLSQVLWLEILPEIDRGGDTAAKASRVLLSTHHFRDPGDVSLQMNIENESDGIFIPAIIGTVKG